MENSPLLNKKVIKSPFRFSRTWEDYALSSAALKIQPNDTILCITGSGDNVLNLLLDQPKQLVAVDILPPQNALLELKIAAIKHLDYEDFLILLGEKQSPDHDRMSRRNLLYQEIREHLPTYALEYFSHQVVESGISTSGLFVNDTVNSFQDVFSKHVEDNDVDDFFQSSTVENQKVAYQRISSGLEATILSTLTKRHMLAGGWNEEQLVDIEQIHGSVSQYLLKHFQRVCLTLPVKDNFFLSWWMRGLRGFSPDSNPMMAPPFLRRENFHVLKNLVGRLKVHTAGVQDYLSQNSATCFDKVYLSNIFERLDLKTTEAILDTVVDSIVPGGRLAYCTLLEPNKMPSNETQMKLTYLKDLSADLQKKDRMMIYSGFHAFTVKEM